MGIAGVEDGDVGERHCVVMVEELDGRHLVELTRGPVLAVLIICGIHLSVSTTPTGSLKVHTQPGGCASYVNVLPQTVVILEKMSW